MPLVSGGGGEVTASAVVTLTAALSIKAAAFYVFKWDGAQDNLVNGAAIGALPAALGLTSPLDGTTELLHATTAGIWSFEAFGGLAADATYRGQLEFGGIGVSQGFAPGAVVAADQYHLAGVCYLPTGADFSLGLTTLTAATGAAYTTKPTMAIVRLA